MDEISPDNQYRALPAQRGMILNSLRFPDDGVDVIQVTFDWDEPLDRAAFTGCWQAAAQRHDVLRTRFRLHGEDGLVQIVDPSARVDVRWPSMSTGAGSAVRSFDAFVLADRREGFDVGRAPLLRVSVLTGPGTPTPDAMPSEPGSAVSTPHHRVLLTFHHAVLDGRSLPLLLAEVFAEYATRRDGRGIVHPERRPYRDFVTWWEGVDLSAAETFWKGHLADLPVARPLPGDRVEPADGQAVPAAYELVLPRSESDRLRAAAQAAGVNVATVVSSAWGLLRGAYGGVRDVVFAVTRSCRYGSVPGADGIMGVLINTVPVRVHVDPQWTVARLLADVGRRVRELRDHQLAPLSAILEWAGLASDTTMLDSLVVYERQQLQSVLARLDPSLAGRGWRVHRLPSYPVNIYALDEPELRLSVTWDRRRLVDGSAEQMLRQLRTVLSQLAGRPDARLSELSLAAESEQDLRAGWNDTRCPYPRDATVPELFAAAVARYPDAPAVVAGTVTLSYLELDERTDRLAGTLRGHGVGTDTLVGVAIPRSATLVQALLAVLKAGGAYLPLDLASPPGRVADMLADSGARLVLTTAETKQSLPLFDGASVLVVDERDASVLVVDERDASVLVVDERAGTPAPIDAASGPLPIRSHPLSLAYVNYTSGSTGTPKGVAIAHRGIVRLVSNASFATLGPGERLLHLAPTAFDATTMEIWSGLLNGATVVVAPPGPLGLPELTALLRGSGLTVVFLTAGLFQQLVDVDAAALAGVGQLVTGGDVADPAAVRAALAARAGRPLVNAYGPTETTVLATCCRITHEDQVGERVPIGAPVRQSTVHVLDAEGRPSPIGVAGELFAGGDGLARGYLGGPAATARAFVPDPDGNGARLYRTGDMVRWRADGVLEFLGRVDDQAKIRGFRVEPGEVESVLRGHPGVRDAVVAVRGAGTDRHLVGYVTPAGGVDPATLRPEHLREFLSHRLPAYLVPAGFAVLDRLPLSANGKVDRNALPPPDRGPRPFQDGVAPPHTPTERRLAELWSRQLPGGGPLPGRIGRADSFFALGGNSLAAARLMFRIRETFGIDLGLGQFYEAPSLAACAAAIDAARGGPAATGIGRRDRAAYRADRPDTRAVPEHLVPLHGGWALWRMVKLRGAGFAADLLEPLADVQLTAAADAALAARVTGDAAAVWEADAAYAAEFPRSVRRLGRALYEAAGRPAFREAVAWQNRHALVTGVDALLRRDPDRATRGSKHRQHEALVANYLHRYCAKNDTIGFFGPVSWARIDEGPDIRITHDDQDALLATRSVYLEGWAVAGVMAAHSDALRPWLVPRRMPFVDVIDGSLRVPLAPPVALTGAEVAVLRACDGLRDAREVADLVLGDPTSGLRTRQEVYDLLARLCAAHRLAWRLDVPPQEIRPEQTVRALLARVTDEAVRAPAAAALDELCAARDTLARSAGDADRVAEAMTGLERTFTRLAGAAPTRRAGKLYAGRTLAYEENLRAGTVRFGASILDGVREPLALVLDSARWFTAAIAALYRRLFTELHRRRAGELGTGVVPFADLWVRATDLLFEPPPWVVGPVVHALQRRWSDVLALPAGQRRVRLSAAELSPRVHATFPPGRLGWPTAVHHCPDLMIVEADTGTPADRQWVLGELHPGVNTIQYASFVAQHESPESLRAAMAADLRRGAVFPAESGEDGGVPSRQSNVLTSARDLRLVFAHDSCGHDPARTLVVGECDVLASAAGLRVRRRDGSVERELMEVIGELVAAATAQEFRILAPAPHTPRVSIDALVVSREAWAFPASAVDFAAVPDEAPRFLRARAWAAAHGLPRHVFVRTQGEAKPIHADLTSLVSVDRVARAVRRARLHVGDEAQVSVVEMLPTPDQLWLRDGRGRRYTSELRLVAVDRTQWS